MDKTSLGLIQLGQLFVDFGSAHNRASYLDLYCEEMYGGSWVWWGGKGCSQGYT